MKISEAAGAGDIRQDVSKLLRARSITDWVKEMSPGRCPDGRKSSYSS